MAASLYASLEAGACALPLLPWRSEDDRVECVGTYHTGAFESSKSAMKTDAPEFMALITILRSTGPVISTLRS